MGCNIKIRGLKKISALDFNVPDSGVWLLTGSNGSGKSSLLACILRIWDPYAFQKNFKASPPAKGRVDAFNGANITYEIDGEIVSYQYVNERWAPTPRKNAQLFKKTPFMSVEYVAADPDRIQPRQEDLNARRIRPADPELVKLANEIFETRRFEDLRRVNVTRGISEALLIETTIAGRKTYFSEKNFSLGEICVLKLLRTVLKQPHRSLVLIDEVELALHPRAQVRLYDVLNRLAQERSLSVILSSHSVTLIKTADRSRTIFLEPNSERIEVRYGCFPSYILGQVAFTEENVKDAIFCVEDNHSDFLLEAIIDRFKNTTTGITNRFPQYSNIRIGGASQVIKIIEACSRMLHDSTRRFGVLDQDVKETLSQIQHETSQSTFLRNNSHLFRFLPVTPEVGLLKWIHSDAEALRVICNKLNVPLHQITYDREKAINILAKTGKHLRDGAKEVITSLLTDLQARSGKEMPIVCRELHYLYVQSLDGDLLKDANALARSLLLE